MTNDETGVSVWELERQREMQERLAHVTPAPSVSQRAATSSVVDDGVSEFLTILKNVTAKYGVAIYWGNFLTELGSERQRIGEKPIRAQLESYAQYIGNNANVTTKVITWEKFYQNRLSKIATPAGASGPSAPVQQPRYDLDAWCYMIAMQKGEVAIIPETMDKLWEKLQVYPAGVMSGRIKEYLDELIDEQAYTDRGELPPRNPDVVAQIEVSNWYQNETKEVPEHFRTMIEGIKQSHIKSYCEGRVKDRLTNPLPIRRKPSANNLFTPTTSSPSKYDHAKAEHDANVERVKAFFAESETVPVLPEEPKTIETAQEQIEQDSTVPPPGYESNVPF